MSEMTLPAEDRNLIQIVNAALADATTRAGKWLVCRKGCTQCCVGVFAINQLDAERLRAGMQDLQRRDPDRASRVRKRAGESISRMQRHFPGDFQTGLLAEGDDAEEAFAEFGDDEVCPVLDPETGACDLYEYRPMTCRVFGPPVRSEDGFGICELCFQGATDCEIAACEMKPDPEDLESHVLHELEQNTGRSGRTVVAYSVK
jgi:Fe-S-cluster containining protein